MQSVLSASVQGSSSTPGEHAQSSLAALVAVFSMAKTHLCLAQFPHWCLWTFLSSWHYLKIASHCEPSSSLSRHWDLPLNGYLNTKWYSYGSPWSHFNCSISFPSPPSLQASSSSSLFSTFHATHPLWGYLGDSSVRFPFFLYPLHKMVTARAVFGQAADRHAKPHKDERVTTNFLFLHAGPCKQIPGGSKSLCVRTYYTSWYEQQSMLWASCWVKTCTLNESKCLERWSGVIWPIFSEGGGGSSRLLFEEVGGKQFPAWSYACFLGKLE